MKNILIRFFKLIRKSNNNNLLHIFNLILLGTFISSSLNAAVININSNNTNLNIGESFEISFKISNLTQNSGDSLSAFDFNILFDTNIFLFTGANFYDPIFGNQLSFNEANAFPFLGDAINTEAGVIDTFGISGNSDITLDSQQLNQFTFLNLSFSALASTALSSIAIDLSDPTLLLVDSGFSDLTVTFASHHLDFVVSQVPEPNNIWLFIVGIPMLILYTFKK